MSTCKACGYPVKWTKTDERWHCRNPDGTDHWDLCSKLRWMQVKATGERFETKSESGYKTKTGKKFDHKAAKTITGSLYTPDSCDCGLPPWDVCDAECKHAIGWCLSLNVRVLTAQSARGKMRHGHKTEAPA